MKKLRVLIADDSQVIRNLLCKTLFADKAIEMVGLAADGREAFEVIKALRPDVATIDINMPGVDGLEAIENIMREYPVPILVISSVSDSPTAFKALSKGALDVIPKSYTKPARADDLVRKIKTLSMVKVIRQFPSQSEKQKKRGTNSSMTGVPGLSSVIAIACSTGGPRALSVILSQLSRDSPYPILIAEHMEDVFIEGLVGWVRRITPLRVKKAVSKEEITPGTVFISPADKSMEVDDHGCIRLVEEDYSEICLPSCNKLLISEGSVYEEKSVSMIPTGMGKDGVEGMKHIKDSGGLTIAQDKETSTIFGMPNEAIQSGCVDHVFSLQEIGTYLNTLAEFKGRRLGERSVGHSL